VVSVLPVLILFVVIFMKLDKCLNRFRNNDGASVVVVEKVIFLQEEVGQHFHRVLQNDTTRK